MTEKYQIIGVGKPFGESYEELWLVRNLEKKELYWLKKDRDRLDKFNEGKAFLVIGAFPGQELRIDIAVESPYDRYNQMAHWISGCGCEFDFCPGKRWQYD